MNDRVALALVSALLLLAPVANARAQDAGGVAAPIMVPVAGAVTASGSGLTVTARPDATLGKVSAVSGTARPGQLVRLDLQDPTGLWVRQGYARAGKDGTFVAHWRPKHIGQFQLRVSNSAAMAVTVYKPAIATWYGPGFFGNATACGIPLTLDLQGVAHRSLPCGTQVEITYLGRTVTVPVIDRGPYGVAGADWDLTEATAESLGITTTSTIGALRLRTTPGS
jgi:rare lipoprotein A